MKNLKRLVALSILLCAFTSQNTIYSKTVSSNTAQVIPLSINDRYVKDIEIRQFDDGKIAIPVKTLAKILEFNYTYDKLNKKLTINDVILNASESNTLYSKNAIITELPDDIFISADEIKKIFNIEINSNLSDMTVGIVTDKKLAVLAQAPLNAKADSYNGEYIQAVQTILPDEKQNFMLKTLNISSNSNMNNSTTNNLVNAYTNSYSSNTFRTTLKGEVLKGSFEVDNNFMLNDSNFNLSGLTARYNKELKNKNIEIGSLKTIELGDIKLADGIFGAKVNGKIGNSKDFRYLKNSEYTAYAGYTDFNNYLMSKACNIDYTKKIIAGGVISKKINNRLKIDMSAVHDSIVSPVAQNNIYTELLSRISPSVLNYGSYKNLSNTQGQTLGLGAKYQMRENITVEPYMGLSHSQNKADSIVNPDGTGFGGNIKTAIKGEKLAFDNNLFYYSPDFYQAGTTGLFGANSAIQRNDRIGTSNGIQHKNKYFSINARSDNYLADLNHRLNVGKLKTNDFYLSGSLDVIKKTPISYNLGRKIASNDYGSFKTTNMMFGYNRQLTRNLTSSSNFNYFRNTLNDNDETNTSLTKNYISELRYSMPYRLGNARLGNEFMSNGNPDSRITTRRVRLGYDFPTIKGVTPSATVGIPYSGNAKGLEYNASVSYRFKSGREIRLSYLYNRQLGYLFDNFYIPETARHTLCVNLVDSLSLYGGIKPTNPNFDKTGFIKVNTFIDKNENGIFDKGEKTVPTINIAIQGNKNAITNKKGTYVSRALQEGNYAVFVDKECLPTYYSTISEKEKYEAKVANSRVTKVNLPIISTPGMISGKIDIKDELGNDVKIPDLALCIYDETGKEVNYYSVDEEMKFNFTNIKPGKYTLKVDKEFEEAYCLKTVNSTTIEIPEIEGSMYKVDNIIVNYNQKDYI